MLRCWSTDAATDNSGLLGNTARGSLPSAPPEDNGKVRGPLTNLTTFSPGAAPQAPPEMASSLCSPGGLGQSRRGRGRAAGVATAGLPLPPWPRPRQRSSALASLGQHLLQSTLPGAQPPHHQLLHRHPLLDVGLRLLRRPRRGAATSCPALGGSSKWWSQHLVPREVRKFHGLECCREQCSGN